MPTSQDHSDEPNRRDGRWNLPAGRAAAAHARHVVRDALHGWGLGPGADDLVEKVVHMIEGAVTKVAGRGAGALDLRLELHRSVRLLTGEIRDTSRDLSGSDSAASPVTAIAVIYGRRPSHGRTGWYTHAFIW